MARQSFRKPRKCKNYKKKSQLYHILFLVQKSIIPFSDYEAPPIKRNRFERTHDRNSAIFVPAKPLAVLVSEKVTASRERCNERWRWEIENGWKMIKNGKRRIEKAVWRIGFLLDDNI